MVIVRVVLYAGLYVHAHTTPLIDKPDLLKAALVSSKPVFVVPDSLAGATGIFVSHVSSTLTTVDAPQLYSFTRRTLVAHRM